MSYNSDARTLRLAGILLLFVGSVLYGSTSLPFLAGLFFGVGATLVIRSMPSYPKFRAATRALLTGRDASDRTRT